MIKYKRKDGIQANLINYNLKEDHQGFLWGASFGGAFRYDGKSYDYFNVRNGLPDIVVLRFIEDPHKTIWAQSYSGELSYCKGDSFVAYKYNDTIKRLTIGDRSWYFQVDKSRSVFLGNLSRGLWKVDSTGKLSNPISIGKGYNGIGIWFGDSIPPVLFGLVDTSNGLNIIRNQLHLFDNDFQHLKGIPLDLPLKTRSYRPFFTECKDGTIVIGYGHYLLKISRTGLLEKTTLASRVNSLCQDHKENLWVATLDSGVIVFPKGNLSHGNEAHYFPGKNINWVTTDRENGIWCSVFGDGIWHMPDPSIVIYTAPENSGITNLFENITASDHLYFIGQERGVLQMDSNGIRKMALKNVFGGRKDETIQALLWDHKANRLLIASDNRLGSHISSGSFSEIVLPEEKRSIGNIRDIVLGINDIPWVIGQHAAYRVQNDSIDKTINVGSSGIRVFVESPDSRYWFGAEEGVWYADDDTTHFLGDVHPLFKGRIYGLCYLHDRLWVAQPELGLGIFDGDSMVKHFPPELIPVLSNLRVEGDTVWGITTAHAIKMVYYSDDSITVDKRIITYNGSNLLNNMCPGKHELWVSSTEGIIRVDRRDFAPPVIPPPVYITDVMINDSVAPASSHYLLEHDQNDLRINFTGITFKTDKMKFRFRMKGLDHKWQYTDLRSIQYSKISPGEYVFEVYAQNADGQWSTQPAMASFIISPPIWKTWWFRVLIFSVVSIGIYILVKRQISKAVGKQQIEKRLLQMESKALRAQINPHFIFNVLGAIQGYVSVGDTSSSQAFLGKFAGLIRMILENSRESFIPLERELETIRYYLELEQIRFRNGFEYRIEIDQDIDPTLIKIPAMLIQPYLENAIIHGLSDNGKMGSIDLRIQLQGPNLVCQIRDYGQGNEDANKNKSKAKYHKPLGMLITRERLTLLNQHLSSNSDVEIIDLSPEPGRLVRLTIPTKPIN